MRVLIMAGGTGGHIFPAIAVAKRLMQQGHTVHLVGSRSGVAMEAGLAAKNQIPIHLITISALRGKGAMALFLAPWRLMVAITQAMWVIYKFKPDVVLGMGGYVTGPTGIAAWLMHRKLIIHEQNAVAGMTNKILARFSDTVLEGFPLSFPKRIKAQVTGNPVREAFTRLPPPQQRQQRPSGQALKILIVGGSGGARTLNNLIPQLLKSWVDATTRPIVWHQAGNKQILDAQQAYNDCGLQVTINEFNLTSNVKLADFIDDMPAAYSWADLVICRAGALTVAELAAAGVASILIPFPYAVDDHQTKNAQYLAQAGAAIIIQESELNLEKLQTLLQGFTADPAKLAAMAQQAYNQAKPEALELVAAACLE